MREDFLNKRYEVAFNLRATLSKNLTDIRPFIGLMKEYAGYAIEYGEAVLPYITILQELFYNKHLLPFVVDNIGDRYKIDQLHTGYVKDFLFYAWLAYKHVEEDWQWDEEQHEYISREWREFGTLKELQRKGQLEQLKSITYT